MPGSAAKVLISEKQQAVLQQIVAATTSPVRLVQRAKIVLLAFAGKENRDISLEIDLNATAVGMWRRRWARAWSKLLQIECTQTHAAFRRAIEDILNDGHRPGCPGKFTTEQVGLILALACEPPELSGRPLTQWTFQDLAEEAMKRGVVDSISATQVRRYLQKAEIKPPKFAMASIP